MLVKSGVLSEVISSSSRDQVSVPGVISGAFHGPALVSTVIGSGAEGLLSFPAVSVSVNVIS